MNRHNKNAMFRVLAAATLAAASLAAQAHGDQPHAAKKAVAISSEAHPFGRQGDPKAVYRTIAIGMGDDMRFSPAVITVAAGETVRFAVRNKGRAMHEMVIGTQAGLKAHGDMMKQHPGMEHDEPYMAHVAPGKKADLVWQFTQPGEFYFACLIPGHFEAGMAGKIIVTKGKP